MFLTQSCYVLKTGYRFNSIYQTKQKISKIIKNPKTDPKTIEKLLVVEDILFYAQTQGLNTSGAYQYFIKNNEAVSFTVSAAYPYELKWQTWWYPIVGEVPYQGYFSKEERDKVAREWKDKNFDVDTGEVLAFSSLGWFQDPVYSTMLDRPVCELAELFFHELTHRTLWTDDVEFNENIATFVGEFLSKKFLNDTKKTKELEVCKVRKLDSELFKPWLQALKKELLALYESKNSLQESVLREKKALIFKHYQNLKPKFQAVDYIGPRLWNNADVLSASLYSPDLESFVAAYDNAGQKNMGAFLDYVKQHITNEISPFEVIQKFKILEKK